MAAAKFHDYERLGSFTRLNVGGSWSTFQSYLVLFFSIAVFLSQCCSVVLLFCLYVVVASFVFSLYSSPFSPVFSMYSVAVF